MVKYDIPLDRRVHGLFLVSIDSLDNNLENETCFHFFIITVTPPPPKKKGPQKDSIGSSMEKSEYLKNNAMYIELYV